MLFEYLRPGMVINYKVGIECYHGTVLSMPEANPNKTSSKIFRVTKPGVGTISLQILGSIPSCFMPDKLLNKQFNYNSYWWIQDIDILNVEDNIRF